MSTRIYRSCKEPLREGLTWHQKWRASDNGLIACWEVGRVRSKENLELALKAKNGELPILPWKGGVDEKIKAKKKYGTLKYLALWQGLRGDDLDIDLSDEPELVCSKTGVRFIYTNDLNKYSSE